MRPAHNHRPCRAALGIPLGALMLTAAVGSFAPAAFGAELFVDKSNSRCSNSGPGSSEVPFCSIKTAAGKVVAGDTVRVRPASYAEAVKFTKSGTSGAPIVFAGEPGATLVGQSYGFYLSGVQWVEVRGFTVSGSTSHGIQAVLSSAVTITGNKVNSAAGSGIYVRDSSDVTLTDNEVQDTLSYGIYIYNDTGVTLRGGRVTRSGKRIDGETRKGIYVNGGSASLITGVQAFDNSDTGIYMTNGATGIVVRANTVHHNALGYARAAAGIETRSAGNSIVGNVGYANEDSGISLRNGGSDSLVTSNVVYDNGDHGIDVLRSPRARIISNSVYGNVTSGINVEGDSSGATIENNISVDNGIGSPRTEGNVRVDGTSTGGTVANYNLLRLSAPGEIYNWGGVEYTTLAQLRAAVPAVEVSGLETDPQWNQPPARGTPLDQDDFRLTSGSPAINSADAAVSGAPQCDADAHLRDGQPDRGAFEFGSAPDTACGQPAP